MSASIAAPPRVAARPRAPERPARLLGFGLVILALSLIPYFCGYLLAPPGKTFLGALNNVGDLSQYLAAIRQGSHGAWRYTNQFTPDHARRLLMYTPYLLVGHFSFGLSPAAAFQVMRLICGGVLLYAIAQFCRLFIGPFALRACWLFVVLASGLYWLALPLSAFFPSADPVALTAPELSPLITLLISPHESLGLAAELLGFLCILRASGATESLWSESRPKVFEPIHHSRYRMGAAAWFLVLALSYPFLLPTVGCVLLAYAGLAALSAWNTRIAAATPKRRLRASQVLAVELRTIVLALVPAGIIALYYADVFSRDPLWSHSGLARIGPPSLGLILFGFGALALAGAGGARRLQTLRRSGGDAVPLAWAWFPVIWCVTNALTILLPVWQQGRQMLGLSVPLALLSFLWLVGPKVVTDGLRKPLPTLPAVALAFSSPLLVSIYTAVTAGGINTDYYAPSSVTQAVEWLGGHAGSNDVILASAGFGNLVPETCSCRVVVGQNFESFDWQVRETEIYRFYEAVSPDAATRILAKIVARENVTMVVYSPLERTLGHVELRSIPGFTLTYDRRGVEILGRQSNHG